MPTALKVLTPNYEAFLDLIAWAEIGPSILAQSDNGYNVLVGSTPEKVKLFSSYSMHPKIRDDAMDSDAAGRYQFMGRYWAYYRGTLRLRDFGPEAQDRWAIQLTRECAANRDIEAGRIDVAISKCRSRWASLPGAGYGQPERRLADLLAVYEQAGGAFA